MSYQIFWQVPQRILNLELEGQLTLEDFHRINEAVTALLGEENANRDVVLVIDVTQPCQIPQAVKQLKESQTYGLRRDLKFIVVVSTNKLARLMMMLTYNLCRPSLRFFDTTDQALRFAQMQRPTLLL